MSLEDSAEEPGLECSDIVRNQREDEEGVKSKIDQDGRDKEELAEFVYRQVCLLSVCP